MDIKDSILSIPYGEIKEYVDTRIQFNELISDKKYRTKYKTILDEIDTLDNKVAEINNRVNEITTTGNCDINLYWRVPRKAVV